MARTEITPDGHMSANQSDIVIAQFPDVVAKAVAERGCWSASRMPRLYKAAFP